MLNYIKFHSEAADKQRGRDQPLSQRISVSINKGSIRHTQLRSACALFLFAFLGDLGDSFVFNLWNTRQTDSRSVRKS